MTEYIDSLQTLPKADVVDPLKMLAQGEQEQAVILRDRLIERTEGYLDEAIDWQDLELVLKLSSFFLPFCSDRFSQEVQALGADVLKRVRKAFDQKKDDIRADSEEPLSRWLPHGTVDLLRLYNIDPFESGPVKTVTADLVVETLERMLIHGIGNTSPKDSCGACLALADFQSLLLLPPSQNPESLEAKKKAYEGLKSLFPADQIRGASGAQKEAYRSFIFIATRFFQDFEFAKEPQKALFEDGIRYLAEDFEDSVSTPRKMAAYYKDYYYPKRFTFEEVIYKAVCDVGSDAIDAARLGVIAENNITGHQGLEDLLGDVSRIIRKRTIPRGIFAKAQALHPQEKDYLLSQQSMAGDILFDSIRFLPAKLDRLADAIDAGFGTVGQYIDNFNRIFALLFTLLQTSSPDHLPRNLALTALPAFLNIASSGILLRMVERRQEINKKAKNRFFDHNSDFVINNTKTDGQGCNGVRIPEFCQQIINQIGNVGYFTPLNKPAKVDQGRGREDFQRRIANEVLSIDPYPNGYGFDRFFGESHYLGQAKSQGYELSYALYLAAANNDTLLLDRALVEFQKLGDDCYSAPLPPCSRNLHYNKPSEKKRQQKETKLLRENPEQLLPGLPLIRLRHSLGKLLAHDYSTQKTREQMDQEFYSDPTFLSRPMLWDCYQRRFKHAVDFLDTHPDLPLPDKKDQFLQSLMISYRTFSQNFDRPEGLIAFPGKYAVRIFQAGSDQEKAEIFFSAVAELDWQKTFKAEGFLRALADDLITHEFDYLTEDDALSFINLERMLSKAMEAFPDDKDILRLKNTVQDANLLAILKVRTVADQA